MLRITVGCGNEDYTSIQEAVNAIPYEFPAEIEVHEGVYREKLFSDKKDLTIRGIGDVKIIWADGAREILDRGIKRGTFRSYTAFFSGEHLHLENLEIYVNLDTAAALGIEIPEDILKSASFIIKDGAEIQL